MTLRLFGLTGGIASGKSTVAAYFRGRGISVIDADQLAREVVRPGSRGLQQIVEAFGPEVRNLDGTLDRRRLASVVFADPARRSALDQIVHPLIRARAGEEARSLESKGEKLACYEAALLIEGGQANEWRPLVLVTAPETVQLERMKKRNGWSEAEARARLASQMPLAEKIKAADIVIPNESSLCDLQRQADQVLNEILVRVGLPPAIFAHKVLDFYRRIFPREGYCDCSKEGNHGNSSN